MRTIFAAGLLLLWSHPALACRQALAVYSDDTGSVLLEFRPTGERWAVTSNEFRVVVGRLGVVLDGIVIEDREIERSDAMIMHNCPEGDVTGSELETCTIWQNVVYAVGGNGSIGLLPAENEAAAAQLLLPDFGRALGYSALYGESGLATPPWDLFKMTGCQE